ncbi:HipA N-terminal domain-containing protein [Salinibius halmophilus]|uniref:HipA N-terminal domain-containing protein n=1 Tax=Salinibius halmophilus TaxID=1853216 RepID=UPI000E6742F3|nr:HipA N-terminal domain-containing protein [Salinibius halmophilus]
MFRKAVVRMAGKTAGYLYRLDTGYRFEYVPGYAYAGVSLSLPVRDDPYEWDELPPAFAALAPEGWIQKRIAMQEKIDENDAFEMLCRFGQDLIGAVEIEGVE